MKEILANKRIFYIILAVVFALAIILRLDLFLFNKSFWFDEAALAINVMDTDFARLFSALAFEQSAPPMFLFETKIMITLFGISEQVFRFIPFVISILSVFLFYFYSKYFIKNKPALLGASFLFGINTNLIYYSTEFKPYALDVFCTLALTFLLLRFKLKHPLALGLLFALCTWYSYSIGIVEFGLVLALLVQLLYHRKKLKDFFVFLAPQIVNFFLFALHLGAIEPVQNYMRHLWSASYLARDFSNLGTLYLDNIYYLFHPYKFVLKAFPYFLPVLLGIICIVGAIILFKQNRFKFLILLMPYFAMLFVSYLHSYPYYDRLTLFLTPIFIILFIKAFEGLFASRYALTVFFVLVVVSLYPVYTSQNVMKNLPAQDFKVFNILHQKYKAGDVIIVNPTSAPSFYYFTQRYKFLPVNDKNIMQERYYTSAPKYLMHLASLDKNKNYWFYTTSVVRPKTIETKDMIEFFGSSAQTFKHYREGKTDLYYVGK